MIDYVKILVANPNTEKIYNNNLLDFKIVVSEKTGDCKRKKVAEYHFCKITLYDGGGVLFTGSIHKMYNSLKGIKAPNYNPSSDKGFNGNLFTLENISEIRSHLAGLLFCEPQQMELQNIEFGINTTPMFDPQLFITGLLYHRGKGFEFGYDRRYAQVEHQRVRLKIYNKGEQYGIDENTLRIEIGCKKAIEFEETGIKTFADVSASTLDNALRLLIKRFDEVVYYDNSINKKKINKREKTSLTNYSNMVYWLDTLKSNKRDEHKKKLNKMIAKYSKNIHTQLRDDLIQKGVIINRLSEKQTRVIINSSNIGLNITLNTTKNKGKNRGLKKGKKEVKKCLVTGLDISMQKEQSRLLSNTGLKFLEKNDNKQFTFLIKTLITGKPNRFEKDIYSKISKQIRNRYRYKSQQMQPTLF